MKLSTSGLCKHRINLDPSSHRFMRDHESMTDNKRMIVYFIIAHGCLLSPSYRVPGESLFGIVCYCSHLASPMCYRNWLMNQAEPLINHPPFVAPSRSLYCFGTVLFGAVRRREFSPAKYPLHEGKWKRPRGWQGGGKSYSNSAPSI